MTEFEIAIGRVATEYRRALARAEQLEADLAAARKAATNWLDMYLAAEAEVEEMRNDAAEKAREP